MGKFRLLRVQSWLQISLFLLTICLPGALMFFLPAKEISQQEKRKLAPPPSWQGNVSSTRRVIQEYLQDHFGLRDQMIFVNSYLDYHIFSRAEKRRTDTAARGELIVGKDGWLFVNITRSLDNHRGLISLSERQLDGFAEDLLAKQRWFAERGIAYYLIIPPDKESIYPEYLPEKYRSNGNPTILDQVIGELQTRGVQILDMRTPLLAAKAQEQLYYRTDSHWNAAGGYLGYTQIVGLLQAQFPLLHSLPPERFQQTQFTLSNTDGADLIGLGTQITESSTAWQLQTPCAQDLPYDWGGTLWSYSECTDGQYKLLVFGDSFLGNLQQPLSNTFQQTLLLRQRYDQELAATLVAEYQPDIVIEEVLERGLWNLMPPE